MSSLSSQFGNVARLVAESSAKRVTCSLEHRRLQLGVFSSALHCAVEVERVVLEELDGDLRPLERVQHCRVIRLRDLSEVALRVSS